MTLQAFAYIVLLGLLFGSSLVASRFGVGQFEPTTYIGLRLVLASLGHAAIYQFNTQRRWPRDVQLWKHAALLGVFGTAVPMVSVATSLQYQSAGMTSILLTAGPAIIVVMAHLFLPDEPLTKRKGSGVLLALSGAFLLIALGETGLPNIEEASFVGYLLVLLAMISSSAMSIYVRMYMREMDSIDVASARMLIAAIVVMPLSVLFIGFDLSPVTAEGYVALIYAALVGTFAGMLLSFYNLKRFGATAAALTSYIIPIVATLGGVLFLNETITWGMMAGMVLIVIGIAIINQRQRRSMVPDGSVELHETQVKHKPNVV